MANKSQYRWNDYQLYFVIIQSYAQYCPVAHQGKKLR